MQKAHFADAAADLDKRTKTFLCHCPGCAYIKRLGRKTKPSRRSVFRLCPHWFSNVGHILNKDIALLRTSDESLKSSFHHENLPCFIHDLKFIGSTKIDAAKLFFRVNKLVLSSVRCRLAVKMCNCSWRWRLLKFILLTTRGEQILS